MQYLKAKGVVGLEGMGEDGRTATGSREAVRKDHLSLIDPWFLPLELS